MKKIVLALVLALTFGFVSLSFAVDGPPATNTPGSSVLPSLSGEGGAESDRFNATSLSEAQKICDQVASANNKTRCTARPIEVTGTTQAQPSVFYCECK